MKLVLTQCFLSTDVTRRHVEIRVCRVRFNDMLKAMTHQVD